MNRRNISLALIIVASVIISAYTGSIQDDEIELTCTKKHSASNTCHYNFTINGMQYRYLDNGCKGKKEDIIKKAKAGKLGLAKDWKLPCPEKKD